MKRVAFKLQLEQTVQQLSCRLEKKPHSFFKFLKLQSYCDNFLNTQEKKLQNCWAVTGKEKKSQRNEIKMIKRVPTIVIPAALLERSALAAEWLADALLPCSIVARPAVCGAVGQVSRCRPRYSAGSRDSSRRRGKGMQRCVQGEQRRRVLLLRAGHRGGVVAVGVLPFYLKL